MSYLVSGIKEFVGPLVIQNDNTADTPLTIKNDLGTTVFTVSNTGATSASGAVTLTNGATVSSGKTLAVTSADKLTVGGVVVGTTVQIRSGISATYVDDWVWVADRAYIVTAVKEIHSVASTSGTILPRKITSASTEAPGATASATCKDFITAALNTNTTANITQAGTLSATASDYTLAAGDKIGIKTAGTFTNLVGACLVITLTAV